MNTTNANQTLGFDKFSESNYNLHWSFSNFNRMLMAAGQIAQLPLGSKVLELGAGTSDLENIIKNNFKRKDIKFVKIDGDAQYESSKEITVFDITSNECYDYCRGLGPYDCVVLMEVIEHVSKGDGVLMLLTAAELLKPEAMLILTTPTPPYDGLWEDRVWPCDHDIEYTLDEILSAVNHNFKVIKKIGWSVEEREFNELLENNTFLMKAYATMKGAFPESYIRAMIASLAPVEANRQVLLVCKKRRDKAHGRFTQTR